MKTGVGHPAKPIDYLPYSLSITDGSTVKVDHMTADQYEAGFEVIQEAAARGDNVGSDEFPDRKSYDNLIMFAQCFAVSSDIEPQVRCNRNYNNDIPPTH